MRKNNAITLVALIITIIILLILAGVVIAMTVGDEGIINKSQIAVDKYQNSAEKEQELLGKVENYIDEFGKEDGTNDKVLPKIIYDSGNQYTEITDGWNVSKDSNGIADVDSYNYILMHSREVGYRGSVVCTNKAIDITAFSKLKIKLKKTSTGTYNIFRYGINKTKMTNVAFNAFGSGDYTITNSNTKAVTTTDVGDNLEVELDISEYTGDYFIGFDLDTCYVEIYKVWLE